MDLSLGQMDIILANFTRKCENCDIYMQPHSTKCVRCGMVQPFIKVFTNSYFEHFMSHRCEVHEDTTFHYCMHPANDSKLEDLKIWCVRCIMQEVANLGGIEIIKGPEN